MKNTAYLLATSFLVVQLSACSTQQVISGTGTVAKLPFQVAGKVVGATGKIIGATAGSAVGAALGGGVGSAIGREVGRAAGAILINAIK